MSTEVFNRILEQLKGFTKQISFHVKGEPLLHPYLDKLLDISYEKGFEVNITTNGTLIDKTKNILLNKPALRQINFSLHSFDSKKQFSQENEYIKNILDFAKDATRLSPLIISLRLWNLSTDNALNLEKKRNQHLLTYIENAFAMTSKIEEYVIAHQGIKLADRIYLNQDHTFIWPDISGSEVGKEGFCYGLSKQAAILVDGTVVPCCLDGEGIMNLGNINNTDFSDIIESKRANDIRNGFKRRHLAEELCRKCHYRSRFN